MSVIRKISAVTGNITTVAGNGIYGSIGDGGPATAAELNFPQTVAIDAAGNIFIADMANCAIREVSAANGNITTVAGTIGSCGFAGDGQAATLAQLNNPTGIAVDSAGNLFIADMNNNVVREVTAQDGLISTIAGNPQQSGYSGDGGPATQAQFSAPFSIVLDGAGNLYIADAWNSAVREVTVADGNIQTVAGDGNWGYSGDGARQQALNSAPCMSACI
jgi:sugar lactone lactonase YvrE